MTKYNESSFFQSSSSKNQQKRVEQIIIIIESRRTDWISGFGCLGGLSEWTKPKAVLSPDAEQVLLTVNQVWNHQRLSSTGRVHLEERNQGQTLHVSNNSVLYLNKRTVQCIILSLVSCRHGVIPLSRLCHPPSFSQ